MKKITLLIAVLAVSFTSNAQNKLDTTGNVGIGTTKPLSVLHINGNNIPKDNYPPNNHSDYHKAKDYDVLYLERGTNTKQGPSMFLKGINNQTSFSARIALIENGGANGDLAFLTSNSKNYNQKEVMRLKYNGNVGIGTTKPIKKLHVKGNDAYSQAMIEGGAGAGLHLKSKNNGLRPVLTGNEHHFSIQTWKNDSRWKYTSLLVTNDGKVGIGTTKPDTKLAVNGTIHTKEVKVDLDGWSDFVFENNYKLPTLTEVENHIKTKGHLQDIPSAKEVEKNGILLGNMNAKLLQKIEELTLYTIQQEKEIKQLNKLKNTVQQQQEEITTLKKMLNNFVKQQKQ